VAYIYNNKSYSEILAVLPNKSARELCKETKRGLIEKRANRDVQKKILLITGGTGTFGNFMRKRAK
jgi:FlaA1/EpsC-like NDP-sugar epimerase